MIPVANTSPSLLSVMPLPTKTPALAVTIPIESTFVTSSYVRTPAMFTFPLAVTLVTEILGLPVNPADVPVILSLAVINPAPFVSWLVFVNEVVIYPAPFVS